MTLSVITINYNNAAGLEKTIKSVISQTNKSYEFIIIDGDSTDGSKEIIERHKGEINYWVSEPDKGIYNAMNKGVKVAKGEYCIFMNSGDIFYSNKVIDDFFDKADLTSDIIEGDCYLQGRVMELPNSISGIFLFKHALCHQASFIKTRLLKTEPYLEDYKIASDWMFFFNTLIIKNGTYQHIDIIVCDFDCNGISATNKDLGYLERKQWLKKAIPHRVYDDYILLSNYEDTKIPRLLQLELSGIGEGTSFEKAVVLFVKFLKKIHKLKGSLNIKISK